MSDGKGTGANFDPVKRTAEISWNIREALRAALPAPHEQFFIIMVPGKDYSEGFDNDVNPTASILRTVTELNQALQCDAMAAPTGKSVSRSYDGAISKLVPTGSTVGVGVKYLNNLTEDEARYNKAME
ncbi:hypothetical protein C0991_008500 [Blastosporella zonata]|nr:hypothetical protein C0991_008500 [Blastosporella zonata]